MNAPMLLADTYNNIPKLIGRITFFVIIAIVIILAVRKSSKK